MDWLGDTWLWIALVVGFFWLHGRMHGAHGGGHGCCAGLTDAGPHPPGDEEHGPRGDHQLIRSD